MTDRLVIDVGRLFGPHPEPKRNPPTFPYFASHFIGFADADYVIFRCLAVADLDREALHHLQQAVEKYLKALLLASGHELTNKTHDLERLGATAAETYPLLGDPSFARFCRQLAPYEQWGHYPERIFDQVYWTPNWNRGHRHGVSEADLVVATLRELAIVALDQHSDAAYLLEALAHREVPFHELDGAAGAIQAALRSALLDENQFIGVDTLPNERQRIVEGRVFPLNAIPRRHPEYFSRMGIKDPGE